MESPELFQQTAAPGSEKRLALEGKPRTIWGDAWLRLRRNRTFLVCGAILLLYVFAAVFAPWVAHYRYDEVFRKDGLAANGSPVAPNAKFWFGTDAIGRDLYSRVVYGAQTALILGLCVATLSVLIGVFYGSVSGMAGGRVDTLMMRIVDVLLSLPIFFIIVFFTTIFDRSLWIIILVMAFLSWTGSARIFRSSVVSIKERDFVLAERSMGASGPYIFLRHILPQLLPLMIIMIGLGIPGAIFLESGLSFLNMGIKPPTPSWGNMIGLGTVTFRNQWWLLVFPGGALVGLVVILNLIADSLRQALDPRLKGR
jgi:peptide/nickel transport system permease protein